MGSVNRGVGLTATASGAGKPPGGTRRLSVTKSFSSERSIGSGYEKKGETDGKWRARCDIRNPGGRSGMGHYHVR